MSARRFFVEGVYAAGAAVEIAGTDAHKIVHVLRLRDGSSIEIVDSAGTLFAATIDAGAAIVRARLNEMIAADAPSGAPAIDLAQAVPKGQKMDFVVEKATELGVAAVLPFYCERTIVKEIAAGKPERWRRLARTAAQQCGRRDIPSIAEPMSYQALLARFASYDVVLFPWELAPQTPLRESLPPALAGAGRALVAIGPEGGFTHDEAEAARDRGAVMLWLGRRILRTETAALALLATIDAFVG